ncbi:hypothetical protein ACUODJ_46735, partial [Escherichia sp. HC-CC]
MLRKGEYERFASDKQCIERALTMWKEWIGTQKEYTAELAVEGTMYVVNHIKLHDYQVSVVHDKQCIERALTMWKEWIGTQKEYTAE